LAFLKSSTVKTFPSGRRRSEEIDKDGSTSIANDKYYIPFDPEARLNTEANARKHSGLNGYTQTYLKEWDNGTADKNGRLLLSLEGYLFDIELSSLKTPNAFGSEIATQLGATTESSIYANIILEDVHLYSSASGLQEYYTSILRDQLNAESTTPSPCLDLLDDDNKSDSHSYVSNLQNYYFSGLSFSISNDTETNKSEPRTVTRTLSAYAGGAGEDVTVTQQLISLRILEKVGDTWQIYQPAYLPRIEHGTTDDSIVVYGDTTIKSSVERPTKLLVEGTAEVQGDTLLKSNLTVKGTTEVDGNTTIHNNLSVDDNINVGSPVTPAIEDNGGYIVAQKNITAEQDLIAKNNLIVGDSTDDTKSGNLTVKNHIETPTIKATTSVTTPVATITDVLKVVKDGEGQANIDNATVVNNFTVTGKVEVTTETTKVKNKLVVENDVEVLNNKITTKDLTSTDTILANNIGTSTSKVTKITARDADIETLSGDDIQQKVKVEGNNVVKVTEDYYDVPVVFVREITAGGRTEHQLQITRINKLN
jgi:hypothetical protein